MPTRACRPRGSAVLVGVVAAALAAAGCHESAAADTAAGPTRGSAASPAAGHAPVTQAEIAARVNAEGERLMSAGKYNAAAMKFDEAAGRVPDAKYLINHCTAVFRGNRLELAYRICKGARTDEATPAQLAEIQALLVQIQHAAKQQGLELCDQCAYEAPPDPPPH